MSPFRALQAPILLGSIDGSGSATFALPPTSGALQVVTPAGTTGLTVVGKSSGASYSSGAPPSSGISSIQVNEAVDRAVVVTVTAATGTTYVTTLPSSGLASTPVASTPAGSSSVSFGYPASSAGGFVDQSSYALDVTAVSGQPILLVNWTYSGAEVSSITDTFATSYTWTLVGENPWGAGCEIWIGTGGVGASGTITVELSAANVSMGYAVPCVGGSSSAGLKALDGYGVESWPTDSVMSGPSITPTAVGEAAFYVIMTDNGIVSGPASPWTTATFAYSGAAIAGVAVQPSAASLATFDPSWDTAANAGGTTIGCVVKAA